MTDTAPAVLPYITPQTPGHGGVLKQQPEDFEVEEIPAYQPSGEGDHLFLWVQKRDTSAEMLTQHLARTLNLPPMEIGVAGMKDRRAITKQWTSVPASAEPRIGRVDTDAIQVLKTARHRHKLRTGHLKANRFSILVREVEPQAIAHARTIAEAISRHGFPNYFGDQRFGRDRETLALGWSLLRGEKSPQDIPRKRRKFLLRLALSAVQSELFNRCLARRLTDGTLLKVFPGDVMQVRESGGVFHVEDPAAEQLRFDAGETTLTGPLFGPKMKAPTQAPADWENETLAEHNIPRQAFEQYRKLTPGGRRPYLIRPNELETAEEQHGIRYHFTLPSGVYATTLLREFMKPE